MGYYTGKLLGLVQDPSPLILRDGNTVGWYDYNNLPTITKDGNNYVSRWNDLLASGHDLIQGAGAKQPLWSANGILFDGSDDFLRTAVFTFPQPSFFYFVVKVVTYAYQHSLLDGTGNRVALEFYPSPSPTLCIYANSTTVSTTNLVIGNLSIIRALFYGANSKLIINSTTPATGNPGTFAPSGITLGAWYNDANVTNMLVTELIARKISDTADNEALIYNYLKTKYNL